MNTTDLVLDVKSLTVRFGGLLAVSDFTFHIKRGEIVALIGPNGAGKTTVFNALTGVVKPTSGDVILLGKRVNGLTPDRIAILGMARTFQNIRLFPAMSVLDNVLVGMHCRLHTTLPGALLGTPGCRREERMAKEEALKILAQANLQDFAEDMAKNLPYGAQRRLEICRALATQPQLVILDEPAAGMNPAETDELVELIRAIRDQGITILLVEHDMRLVMTVAERIFVLDHGVQIAEGDPAAIQANPAVIAAYLGQVTE